MHSQFFHFELDFMQFSKQPFAAFLNGDFLLILQYRSARFCLLFFLNESVPSEPCRGRPCKYIPVLRPEKSLCSIINAGEAF